MKYEITEEQIKDIYADGCTYIKRWFPEVFETKFKNGWYKHSNGCWDKWLVYADFQNNKSYGIVTDDSWSYSVDLEYIKRHCKLATDSEVLEALTNEAKKRGFKSGVYINNSGINSFSDAPFNSPISGIFVYNKHLKVLDCEWGNGQIFENGKWAEIIKTYTKKEAEKLLNAKII